MEPTSSAAINSPNANTNRLNSQPMPTAFALWKRCAWGRR
jgi:hypothetical protein